MRAGALVALAGALALAPGASANALGVPPLNAARHWTVGGGAPVSMAIGADVQLAELSEEDLPAEEMPSPSATPDATPAAAGAPQAPAQGEGGGGEWTRVPADSNGESANATSDAPPSQESGAPASSAGGGPQTVVVPGAEPSAGVVPAQAGASALAAGAATPEPSAAALPPPYDIGSVQPAPPVSDQPLTPLIDAAAKDQPALSASLRLVESARGEIEKSRADDAIRSLGRAVSIDPTDPYAYFYLGRAYMAKNDYPQALAFFGRSEVGLRATPVWLGEVKSFEGACLEQQGKFAQAAQAYRDALEAAPNNLMARVGYGRLTTIAADANAGNAPPPPAPAVGAALPAPDAGATAPPPEDGSAVAEPPDEPPPAPAGSATSGKSFDQSGGN
jgi:hypothetical protein